MKKNLTQLPVSELVSLHRSMRQDIKARLEEFSRVPQTKYFYELAYCLLTPQSSAVNADKAITELRKNNFHKSNIDPVGLLYKGDYYIRFHKTKAKHLLAMKEQFPLIRNQLINGNTSIELRAWLLKNVKGLGWKEASHFLRNIGHRNLAILDRHILKNLVRVGVLKELPKTLTAKRYLEIEKKFQIFAGEIKIPIDELDLLFWSMETGEILK